ncbi:30S ribosome-binding factor RbfA [Hyphomicrobiales bacterium]|nr:30S ribosome-binding factor RbfA [Rhodobiaceae bacterium]MDB4831533.1 30S ribosome-binding factor RbfA [Hyphomicrobiales bacterium]MBT5640335.1 30S ribosome-binding factor RbfA [Rhodobiaceae bacterium]MBT6223622.1 30S ribosome-binding factor RbfA [Rhodobiaceae bacterium]MDC0139558.1 30S ribosome-binding factor RbfA [Hyphomicrobiales bacterium]
MIDNLTLSKNMLDSKKQPKNKSSQRQLRVGELIRHALSEMMTKNEIYDQDLMDKTITITEVAVTPDLKKAIVYIMPLGGFKIEETIIALNKNVKFIRGQVTTMVSLKHTPGIYFKEDTSFAYSNHINNLLKSSSQEDL